MKLVTSQKGMTLIETMIASSTVLIVMTMIGAGYTRFSRWQQETLQKAQLKTIASRSALQMAHLGRYARGCSRAASEDPIEGRIRVQLTCDVELDPAVGVEPVSFEYTELRARPKGGVLAYYRGNERKLIWSMRVIGFIVCDADMIVRGECPIVGTNQTLPILTATGGAAMMNGYFAFRVNALFSHPKPWTADEDNNYESVAIDAGFYARNQTAAPEAVSYVYSPMGGEVE